MQDYLRYLGNLKSYDLKVLLADDSRLSLLVTKEAISKYFKNIDTAQNGEEALNLFNENSYDIVITDVIMPKMDGIELTNAIRQAGHNTPIVAISGSSEESRLIDLINCGVTSFLIKPFKEKHIAEQLYRVCKPITNERDAAKRLNSYMQLVDENVITSTTDLNGNIIQASQAFCRISQYSKEELIGKNHNILKHPESTQEIYSDIWNTIILNNTWSGELQNLAKDQTPFWVHTTISSVFDDLENKVGYVAIRTDITDKKKIEEMSITDGLTSLFNRRYYDEMSIKLLNIAKRDNNNFTFVLLDVDNFKKYNDTYGHKYGDDVLVAVSSTIKKVFKRAGDYCFRLGGEEFIVIFNGQDKEHAFTATEKLRAEIQGLNILHEKNCEYGCITVSIGLIVENATDINSIEDVYKQADELLYHAKEGGRNRICKNF